LVHPYFTIMGQYYSGKGAKMLSKKTIAKVI